MQEYISSLGCDIWEDIKNGYTIPFTPIIDAIDKKMYENNSKAKNAIMCRLVDTELLSVMNYMSTKEIWYKIKNIHEGDMKTKEAKLQAHRE